MADVDPADVFAIDAAERIVAAELVRPKPPPDDEAEVISHWYPWPSGNVWCDRCDRLDYECACWADMLARRAVAEDLRADVDLANDWCTTQPGCCDTCGGKGGACTDCYGTGHLHLGPCTVHRC